MGVCRVMYIPTIEDLINTAIVLAFAIGGFIMGWWARKLSEDKNDRR